MDTKTEANKLNAELLALYEAKKDIFARLRAKKDELALSLMLPFVCEEFMRSKSRLMIIGQETFGWNFRESETAVMQKTQYFLSHDRYKHSPFWRLIKQVYEGLGERLEHNFTHIVWDNVRKVCFDKDKGKIPQNALPQDIQSLIDANLNELLLKEMQIIKPKIALFLTGPAYDKYIKAQLKEVRYQSVKEFAELKPALKELDVTAFKPRQMAILTHEALPNTLILRIYHPNFYYMRVAKRFPHYFDTLIKIAREFA